MAPGATAAGVKVVGHRDEGAKGAIKMPAATRTKTKDYPKLQKREGPESSMVVGEQAGALGVPQKVHTQKSTGKPVTASMDAYKKLQEIEAENEASEPKATPVEKRILGKLGDKPVHIDKLARELDLPIWEVSSAMSLLELKGDVKKAGGAMGKGMFYIKVKPDTMTSKHKAKPGTKKPKSKQPTAFNLMGIISREDADELITGLDLRIDKLEEGIDQGKATVETIKESLDPRIAKLTELIPTTKEGGSEITHITKGQYRKVWGKEPPASIVSKGKVRWEYALDTIAQELHLESKAKAEGKAPDEYLKELIENAKGTKELLKATQVEIASDESTLKAIEKLKDSIKGRVGKTTSEGALERLTKPSMKGKRKPEQEAEKMLASEAQALIDKVQSKRTPKAIAIDNSRLAIQVVPLSKAGLWGKHPNRLDIKGVDTPRRVLPGIGYSDKRGRRLSRTHHRGFKKIKFA
jgi:hypothetical protein